MVDLPSALQLHKVNSVHLCARLVLILFPTLCGPQKNSASLKPPELGVGITGAAANHNGCVP